MLHSNYLYYQEGKIMGNEIILPRLVLSYYFLIAVIITVVFLILWVLFKKRQTVKRCISKVFMLTGAYIIAQISYKGFKFPTHTLQEDLIYILFRTIIIYLIALIVTEITNSKTKFSL